MKLFRFEEIKKYIARNVKGSLCFHDGYYHDYLMISDIPKGKYDHLYVSGVGMADVEFSRDVYSAPLQLEGEVMATKDDYIDPAIEIVLTEEPRDIECERSTDKGILFQELKPYLQIGRNFSIVNREDWSYETYEYRSDISEEYNDMYVYGIGMEDNPDVEEYVKKFKFDSKLKKRMVIVLSDKPKKEAVVEKNSSTYGKGPFFLVYTAEGWNHDADEWIGIYTDRKETREAYDRAVAYYEEEAKRTSYRSRQRVVIMEFILEEDRFREVDREELN